MTQERIETADEFLEHYGVKGMRWGVRNESTVPGGAAQASKKKKPTNSDIKDARAKTASRQRQLSNQIDRANLAKPGMQQDDEIRTLQKMSSDFLKNPDRATALRMTTGEKAILSILAVAVPGPGTAASAATAGSRVLVRKSIEKDVRRANGG